MVTILSSNAVVNSDISDEIAVVFSFKAVCLFIVISASDVKLLACTFNCHTARYN